jgi:hypothetical protein
MEGLLYDLSDCQLFNTICTRLNLLLIYHHCAGSVQITKDAMSHILTVCQLTVPPCRGSFFPPAPPAALSVVSPVCKGDRIWETSSPDTAVSGASDQITCKLLGKHFKRKLREGSTVRTSAGVSNICTVASKRENVFESHSQWPRGLKRRPTTACMLVSWFRIP